MAVIERKSIEKIEPRDRLVENLGRFLKAGSTLEEKGLKFLKDHKVKIAPTIALTHAERQALPDPHKETEAVQNVIYQSGSVLLELREELFDQLEPIFRVFSEKDKIFETPGKTKQIKEGDLLKPKLDQVVQLDVDNGSQAILPPSRVQSLMRCLGEIYDRLNKGGGYRGPETLTRKHLLPRNAFASIRTLPIYQGGRVDQPGTALAWHGVDTAIYMMTALLNINKKRHLLGLPYSQMRFDVDSSFTSATVFRYKDEYLVEASLGAALHPLGYCHSSIYPFIAQGRDLEWEGPGGEKTIKAIQPNIQILRNLLRERRDISALARMIAGAQGEYPDGTGYPPAKEGAIPHEFVRLFHVIDTYDTLANPYLYPKPFVRQEILEYLELHSQDFPIEEIEFPTASRYDRVMVEEFFWVLAPYNVGEILYLSPRSSPREVHFQVQVYGYFDSPVPMLSVLKDLRSSQDYNFGKMIWNLTTAQAFLMENSKIKKQTKVPWLSGYKISDPELGARSMSEYQDYLYRGFRNPQWDLTERS